MHRKSLGGSTSRSSLNAQSRGRMTERGSNSRNRGKSRGKSKGRRSQLRGQMTTGNQGTKRKIIGIKKKMNEIN